MKRISARKGSALLIVLGMLSFMVISAVAFSAYMRYARMPSSYLRRNSASRLLVKAAVARAIDAIDAAVANDPHPGVGNRSADENRWRGRVLIGQNDLVDFDDTVPVLTLESLAYIPPALVNEARYFSRRSPAARWHSFGFDSGRFAFCAMDVSDCLDVNRLVADYPRSSASNRRITLGYLFEGGEEHDSVGNGATQWDTFMEDYRTVDPDTLAVEYGEKIPLVSVADLNLAMGNRTFGKMRSPFWNYVWGSAGNGFYNSTGLEEEDAMRRMMFVTDGWFPASESQTDEDGRRRTVYDLGSGDSQPYSANVIGSKGKPPKLSTTVFGTALNGTVGSEYLNRLSGLGCAALADYLDVDRVPVSLAIPTTERVPMVCGVQPLAPQGASFGIEVKEGALTGRDGAELPEGVSVLERDVEQSVRYVVKAGELAKLFMGAQIRSVVAFPFLHGDGEDSGWKLDGKFCLFLTSGAQMPLRTGNQSDVLHCASASLPNTDIDAGTGVLTVRLQQAQPTFPAAVTEPKNAVWDMMGAMPLDAGVQVAQSLTMNGNELLSVTYQWKQTRHKDPYTGQLSQWEPDFQTVQDTPPENVGIKAHCAMRPLVGSGGSIGSVDPDFENDEKLAQKVRDKNWSKRLYLNAAVWLRLKDSDGKVVDMVPACIPDDKTQNSISDPDVRIEIIGKDEFAGAPYPVLRFGTGVEFEYGVEALKTSLATAQPIEYSPKSLMVADPRFNYAPEHWFEVNDDIDGDYWLNHNLVGSGRRNRDIFLATSDAGYLQSIYELAFLPRFTDLRGYGATVASGNMASPASRKEYANSAEGAVNSDLMWRSYDPFDLDEETFDELPFTSAGTGMKVNPYSDSTNVIMAAFANTPVDWRRASTNLVQGGKDYASMTAKEFNSKYAWNAYGASGSRFDWLDLEAVAARFIEEVRQNNRSWKTAWQNMGWDSADKTGEELLGGLRFEGGGTAKLRDCDRRFLYGFWRDCFAAKQQLFLVFVRAEPMMMGGDAIGQVPPQLGGRAVALVWRDPTATAGGSGTGTGTGMAVQGYPHRTRVLFYRQMD